MSLFPTVTSAELATPGKQVYTGVRVSDVPVQIAGANDASFLRIASESTHAHRRHVSLRCRAGAWDRTQSCSVSSDSHRLPLVFLSTYKLPATVLLVPFFQVGFFSAVCLSD